MNEGTYIFDDFFSDLYELAEELKKDENQNDKKGAVPLQ